MPAIYPRHPLDPQFVSKVCFAGLRKMGQFTRGKIGSIRPLIISESGTNISNHQQRFVCILRIDYLFSQMHCVNKYLVYLSRIFIQFTPLAAMAVSVVDVRRGFVRSSLPSGVLRFPAASASLLYVEDAVAVDAADVKANAQAGMAEAVFFSFTNLHQVSYTTVLVTN